MNFPIDTIANVAQNGSPVLLEAAGRVFGLGTDEQTALARGALPGWAILGIGLVAGVALGVYAHRTWPQQAGKIIGG